MEEIKSSENKNCIDCLLSFGPLKEKKNEHELRIVILTVVECVNVNRSWSTIVGAQLGFKHTSRLHPLYTLTSQRMSARCRRFK